MTHNTQMLTLFLPSLLLTSPSMAAPTVAIVGIHQDELTTEEQATGSAKVEKAIKKQGFSPVATEALASAIKGREEIILKEAFLGPGQKLLDNGRDLYQQADFEKSEPILVEATETLTLGIGSANSAGLLWEAYTLLGTVRVMIDDQQGASDAFANAVALNPARTPNAAQFPPDVVRLYADVQSDLKGVSSTLRVKADQEEVKIFLNGEDKGLAPATIREVVPGFNHVVAHGNSGSHAYQQVEVPEAGNEVILMRMSEPSLGQAAAKPFARRRQTATLYRSFGEHSGADLVLLAGTTDDTVLLQLYSPLTDAFCTPVEAPFTGGAIDETIASLPDLFKKVQSDGTFFDSQKAATAAPLDVGVNKLLATMLLNPNAGNLVPVKKASPVAVIAGVGTGVALLLGGGIFALTYDPEPIKEGAITVLVE